jgi:hypothetical protein
VLLFTQLLANSQMRALTTGVNLKPKSGQEPFEFYAGPAFNISLGEVVRRRRRAQKVDYDFI